MIRINRPHIEKITGGGRLVSEISVNGKQRNVFYGVDSVYSEYLCFERSDAFLTAALPMALAMGEDIYCEAPVSEQLYWYITNIFIPSLNLSDNKFKKINIFCETANDNLNVGKAVGTAISCGVDSFYSILSNHDKTKTMAHNVTHLTLFNVGALGYYGGEKARELFREKAEYCREISAELRKAFVAIDSNISEFLMMDFEATNSFRNISAVLALQKLFSTYYLSSGENLADFKINIHDSEFFDLLNCSSFSNESVNFFSTGCGNTRMDKVKFISNYPITYKYLNVCNSGEKHNCGNKCMKCLRTQAELYAIGKLEEYSSVFDVQSFLSRKNLYFSKLIAQIPYSKAERIFLKETTREMRINGKSLAVCSYIMAIPGFLKSVVFALLSKNNFFRKMVHRKINHNRRDKIVFID